VKVKCPSMTSFVGLIVSGLCAARERYLDMEWNNAIPTDLDFPPLGYSSLVRLSTTAGARLARGYRTASIAHANRILCGDIDISGGAAARAAEKGSNSDAPCRSLK